MTTPSNLVSGAIWQRATKRGVANSTVLFVTNEGASEEVLAAHPQQVVFLTEQFKVLSMGIDSFISKRTFAGVDTDLDALINLVVSPPPEEEEEVEFDPDAIEVDETLFASVGNDSASDEEAQAGTDNTAPVSPESIAKLVAAQNAFVESVRQNAGATLNVGQHAKAAALEEAFCGYAEVPYFNGDTLHTLRFVLSPGLNLEDIRAAFWLQDPNAIQNVTLTSSYEVTKIAIDSFITVGLELFNGAVLGSLNITSAGDFRGETEIIEVQVMDSDSPAAEAPVTAPGAAGTTFSVSVS